MQTPYNLTSRSLAIIRIIFILVTAFSLLTFRQSVTAAPHKEANETAFQAAAFAGDIPAMKILIDSGANVNEENIYGITPLHYALIRTSMGRRQGRIGVVSFLVNHGANVNSKTITGRTPLMEASNIGDTDATKFLVANGAQIDLSDKYGSTALGLATSRLYYDIVSYLVAHNVNIDIHDEQGRTPLMQAIAASSLFTIQNEKERSIEEVNRLSIVNLLLEHHADVNSADKSGWTPLALAAENNSTEILKTLINHGASQNIHVPSLGGETPLMTVIRKNNLEILKLLISAKPDLTLANSQGRTALSYARGYRDEEMIEILKKAEATH